MEILVAVVLGLIIGGVLLVRSRRADVRHVDDAPPRGPEDIRSLVDQGRTIDAIKAYRALHGVGLKEAKEAVEALARGESPAAPREFVSDEDIEAEVRAGNLIAAIRLYRQKTGAGLVEAKTEVEAMRERLERR